MSSFLGRCEPMEERGFCLLAAPDRREPGPLPLRTINRFAADRNNLFKRFRYAERIKINDVLVHDQVRAVLFTVTVNGIKQKIFGDAQVFGELAIAPIDFCSRRSPDIVLPPHPFGNCPSLPSLAIPLSETPS